MSRIAAPLASALVLAALAALAACSEHDELRPPTADAPGGDVDAPAGVDAPGAAMPVGFAVAGDFNVTGVFSTIDPVRLVVHANALPLVAGGEPWIRRAGDELFVVNRSNGENVTVLRRAPLGFVDQYATGGGSNPQDVAQVGRKLYIPALGTAGVVVIDRDTRATTTISLAALDPDDGHPDCVSAYAVGTRVFVACGRLDGTFTPRGPGRVAVIDTATDTMTAMFDLPAANPQGLFQATPPGSMFGGDLLIPLVPSFTSFGTGCLARVRTTGTPAADGCAVTNQALGGYVNRVAVAPEGDRAWLAVFAYNPDFSVGKAEVRPLAMASGELGEAMSAPAEQIVDVAACAGDYQLAFDGTFGAGGVRVFHAGVETTTQPLDIGRPPMAPNGLACD